MKILVADKMDEGIVRKMKKLGDVVYMPADLNAEVANAEIIVVRSKTQVNKDLLGKAQNLKLVIRAGVGTDNIDMNECKAKNIEVKNTPLASTNAVSELALGAIICLRRNVGRAHHGMKNKKWEKSLLEGHEIKGAKLGIIGFGRIGQDVAKKAKKLGMKILAYDPRPIQEKWAKAVSLDELFQKSDVISLHTVLVPETKNMVNKERIATMKDGAYIINFARGGLVDEEALYEALKSGKLAGAALDVYPEEPYVGKLTELDNVLLTPHLGASSFEGQKRIGDEVLELVRQYKEKQVLGQ